jgi:hypothetical protein
MEGNQKIGTLREDYLMPGARRTDTTEAKTVQ